MSKVRFVHDRDGVREVALAGDGIRAYVAAIAEGVAGRARMRTDNEIEVAHAGVKRARSYVRIVGPDGAAEESRTRALGGSL